jgi:hypothetical protein
VNEVRIIGILADRLLGAVVPEITAGACCPQVGERYYNYKCVKKGVGAKQLCTVTCGCGKTCGGWVDYADSNCL